MRKDFNVYQWRRDHLFENKIIKSPEEIAKEFTKKYSDQPNIKFSDRGGDKYRVQIYDKNSKLIFDNPKSKEDATDFFDREGYIVNISLDDKPKSWVWDFDFTLKKKI